MVLSHKIDGDDGARNCRRKRIPPMIAILVIAVALGIAATATISTQYTSAHAGPLGVIYAAEPRDALAGSPQQNTLPEIEYVWAARITVADAPTMSGTRLGYVSGTDHHDEVGRLEPGQFTYDGEDHAVQALYYQQTPESGHQLVFETDRPLPAGLILHVGSDRYFGCEFVVLGSEGNTNVWTITRDLGWEDGRTTYAVLFEPRVHQVQPVIECLAASAEPGS